MKRLTFPVLGSRVIVWASVMLTCGSVSPAWRRACSSRAASAAGEVAAGDARDVDAPLGLPDLVFADRVLAGQGAADHVVADGHAAVAEYLIGPPVDAGAQPAGARGAFRRGEPVGELVAHQRLGEVVQVGHQHLGRGRPGGDRVVVVIDQLGQAHVAGKTQHRPPGLAVADEPLGGTLPAGAYFVPTPMRSSHGES